MPQEVKEFGAWKPVTPAKWWLLVVFNFLESEQDYYLPYLSKAPLIHLSIAIVTLRPPIQNISCLKNVTSPLGVPARRLYAG